MLALYKELAPHFLKITHLLTDTGKEVAKLDKIFRTHGVKKVLDVACGAGRHSVRLAKLGYQVTGIDYSKWQVREARKHAKKENVAPRFFVRNANRFSFSEKFDAAICMWTTIGEEPMVYEKVMRNVHASLRNGGVFVIDNNAWAHIPESGEEYIEGTTEIDGTVIKQYLHDRYTDHFRVREGRAVINGKTYENILCITHIKRPHEWALELKKAGFRKTFIVPDYEIRAGKHRKKNVLIVGIK